MYDGVKFGYELHRKMLQTYEPDTFHAYPAFTFTPEGRKGEQQVIDYIKKKMSS